MNTSEIKNDIELKNKMIEHFEKQLERTNYWLSFAEAKNGALIAINVALTAALITLFDKAPIFCIIAISFYLVSCILSLISFIPNTNSRPEAKVILNNENNNLLFYGDIATIGNTEKYIELSIKKYFPGQRILVNDRLVYDLASEIIINSRITTKKYRDFKRALKVDFLAVFLTIIFLCAA